MLYQIYFLTCIGNKLVWKKENIVDRFIACIKQKNKNKFICGINAEKGVI